MTNYIITALVLTIAGLIIALWNADRARRLAQSRIDTWCETALSCSEDADNTRLKLDAALCTLAAIEETQRQRLASFVVIEAEGRKIIQFRN